MKPICVPCQRFFRPKKTGKFFLEGMPVSHRAISGTATPELWKPYKLWQGDEWVCQGCGAVIIVGTGLRPLKENHEKDFKITIDAFNATYQVNDC